MKNPLKNLKYIALVQIAVAIFALIDLFLGEPGRFPKGFRIVFAAGVLITGIAFLFYKEKPDSPDLKENR